jgi:hypothetical protein
VDSAVLHRGRRRDTIGRQIERLVDGVFVGYVAALRRRFQLARRRRRGGRSTRQRR